MKSERIQCGGDVLFEKLNQEQKVIRSKALDGIHILLVEDFVDNQILIKKFLTLENATVDIANDGEEGVSMAMAAEESGDICQRYDIVLMDIQMPKVDGYEALKRLRQLGWTKPVVALTAHGLSEERARCVQLGFDEFLSKPIHRPLLISLTSDLVNLARQKVWHKNQ